MTGFIGANPNGVYSAVTSTSSNPDAGQCWGLGDRYVDASGNGYVFVSASTSITSYQAVAIATNYYAVAATSAAATAQSLAGVAGVNGISSGSWGWVQTRGNFSGVNVLSTCSASSYLYTTATAGSLDDTSTSQVKVAGLTINANATTPAAAAAFSGVDIFFSL